MKVGDLIRFSTGYNIGVILELQYPDGPLKTPWAVVMWGNQVSTSTSMKGFEVVK